MRSNKKIEKSCFLYDGVKVKEETVTKTVKLDLALNDAVEAASKKLGENFSTIMRMAIRAGLPVIERHHLAMTSRKESSYPVTEITALRAAETPKKSNRS